MSREEAIALDLIEALDEIHKKKGLNNFKLYLRLSKDSANPKAKKLPRWDKLFLK